MNGVFSVLGTQNSMKRAEQVKLRSNHSVEATFNGKRLNAPHLEAFVATLPALAQNGHAGAG
jgi:uncharacterized protein YprB with RNaseH-like and TPR domain